MAAYDSTARLRRVPVAQPGFVEELSDSEDDNIFVPRPEKVTTATTTATEAAATPTETQEAAPSKPRKSRKKRLRVEEEDDYSPYLDIVRVVTFLLVASCGVSYLVSNGESYFWGMKNKPDYLKLSWWKLQYNGPKYLTLDELARYDGTNPNAPVYLSINGSIYDVSAGRHIYGPGGSYHYFAGVDASRGFVTGCFAEDRTGDVRGVEEMFLPLDNPEIDSYWTPEELAKKKEDELHEARKRVQGAVKHWSEFFRKSTKYSYVGQLVRELGWEGELKPLCKVAQDGRGFRTSPKEED
ncbi:cytochrome b5-like heme steroid binding domain-containing protein [Ophiostoma piceae UAMH 11346]|uniref:Cytochrome b5-like heme steroid binding domain-containing protein n=1 Tax=Ophiostoma piceae (strain UAMH 11346) TaxID=1262450 RepID=S3C6R9_OPHP1|nr:cytochrome b5-like heme steroid binding domain-containing protein [Ophiostoma piceae UAMH 11346]